ncbi:unnamed protein product [Urochloa humidicola]
MKLLIDTKAQRVLFAEAGKEVVDFLFSLLAFPIATAVKLVGTTTTEAMAGSVGSLDATYVQPGAAKDALLSPTVLSPAAISAANSSLLRLPAPPPPSSGQPRTYFKCGCCTTNYVTDASGVTCPNCRNQMKTALKYVAPSSAGEEATTKGLVQGVVTYTVTDDLTVAPMSAISSITMLNTFIGDLQEKTVQLGYDEGREILKASLQSKTVLTDVFLGNKA